MKPSDIDLSLALPMLNELIRTIRKAKEVESNTLEMSDWVVSHSCGTEACICGYQALSRRFKWFPNAAVSAYSDKTLSSQANEVSTDIDRVLGKNLGRSIWDTMSTTRGYCAIDSGLFTEDEISNINHLNCNSSTFDAVIEYLKIIKSKLNNIALVSQLNEGIVNND